MAWPDDDADADVILRFGEAAIVVQMKRLDTKPETPKHAETSGQHRSQPPARHGVSRQEYAALFAGMPPLDPDQVRVDIDGGIDQSPDDPYSRAEGR